MLKLVNLLELTFWLSVFSHSSMLSRITMWLVVSVWLLFLFIPPMLYLFIIIGISCCFELIDGPKSFGLLLCYCLCRVLDAIVWDIVDLSFSLWKISLRFGSLLYCIEVNYIWL